MSKFIVIGNDLIRKDDILKIVSTDEGFSMIIFDFVENTSNKMIVRTMIEKDYLPTSEGYEDVKKFYLKEKKLK